MNEYILAYDLGTGGNKTVIYDFEGNCIVKDFEPYKTYYPSLNHHEQKPDEWWDAIIKSTKRIIEINDIDSRDIKALSISGHSLGVVPINRKGELLLESVPIWSDTRATKQCKNFFNAIDYREWYSKTGNGFSRECYSIFKIMWIKENYPEVYKNAYKILGTKDYINYKLTGKLLTDYSYASGSGVYDLLKWEYSRDLINLAGIKHDIFPDIVPSTQFIGSINKETKNIFGFNGEVKVFCGGVDNSCMALGAKNNSDGRVYLNLGSSAWIAASTYKPIIDTNTYPFVFTHVIPGMFTSSFGTFSAGNSLKWVKDNLCGSILKNYEESGSEPYEIINEYAERSPVGSNKLIFNPSLAGGSRAQPSTNIKGGFCGLDLSHNISDLIRSCMEGIVMDLKILFDKFKNLTELDNEILFVGGGSKSSLWRQITADVFNCKILKTNVGQEAAALGAAALAAVGMGVWKDFKRIDEIHEIENESIPNIDNVQKYQDMIKIYSFIRKNLSETGDMISKIKW